MKRIFSLKRLLTVSLIDVNVIIDHFRKSMIDLKINSAQTLIVILILTRPLPTFSDIVSDPLFIAFLSFSVTVTRSASCLGRITSPIGGGRSKMVKDTRMS